MCLHGQSHYTIQFYIGKYRQKDGATVAVFYLALFLAFYLTFLPYNSILFKFKIILAMVCTILGWSKFTE